jgi:outer membrane protein assembly factor BamB
MMRTMIATLTLVLTATSAPGQERERLYSDPAIPPREALDRLNLEIAWRVELPMQSRRDGVVSIQHTGRQIVAQTRGGIVALFDAETGRPVWRVRIGEPYLGAFPPAFNSSSVFAINGTILYALDRSNGALLWQLSLPGGLVMQPLADEDQVYIFTGTGLVYAYHPTTVEVLTKVTPFALPPSYGERDVTIKSDEQYVQQVRPILQWDATTRLRVELGATQSPELVLVPDPGGQLLGLAKYPKQYFRPEAYRFPLESPLLAGPGAFGSTAYFPGRDGYVYAFDMARARIVWRQLVGTSPVIRTPIVSEQDVIVVSEREGMSRLDRETGTLLWRIPAGNRLQTAQADAAVFLAASPKFVYALDRSGRLVVLDRSRGLLLSRYDVRDFVVPVVNEQTDRVYLAANNGLLLCLRDRDYPEPQRARKLSDRESEAGKSPDERARDLREYLTKPVNFDAGEAQPLSRFLDDLRRVHGIKAFVSDKSFRESGLPSPLEQKVKVPKKEKTPLGDVIQEVLGQINCKYAQLGDEIFIIPAKVVPKP